MGEAVETSGFLVDETRVAGRPAQGTARVVRMDADDAHLLLHAGDGLKRAVCAASCMLVPQPGDTVAWLAAGEEGACYVIAVLERDEGVASTVSLPPDAVIKSKAGKLELQAESLTLRSRELSVEAERACLSADQVVGVGTRASWSFGVLRVTAELVETFAERLLQFSRWSKRLVDGPDQVRSRQIDWRAEHSMQLQSQVIIADAEKLLKADGDQIHLG